MVAEQSEIGPAGLDGVEWHFLHRGFGPEFEMEAAYIRSYLPDCGRWILDIGCGIGGLFDSIGANRVLGADGLISGLMLTRKAHPQVPLATANAASLPFRDGSVHAVTAQHLVEHLTSFAAICREWRRVLQPNGLLIIATPNAGFVDPSVYDDPSHVEIYSGESLRAALEPSGFKVLDIRSLGLPWFRQYGGLPGGWRMRRAVLRNARLLSQLPGLLWKGQTLCCVARKT